MPWSRNFFCIGLKKSQKASQVFGASANLKPAFSTSEVQTWNGTTAVLYGIK